MAKLNAMDAFCERYGLIKGWLSEACGLHLSTFNDALWKRGFRPDEAETVERFLKTKGKELQRFKFSDDSEADLERLRSEFGIKKAWLAAQLSLRDSAILYSAKRIGGFRDDEKEVLLLAIREISRAMTEYQIPSSLRKAA